MESKLPIKIDLPADFLDEEVRCGYTVSSKMKAVWAVELDLLEELKRVCDKHNILLYADGGTVLGAVRHKGFIPWDDDIDLAVSREDYDKLLQVAKEEFTYPYFLSAEETEPGTCRGHAQLRNSLTTGFITAELNIPESNKGIFIDIFPHDNVPENADERHKYLVKVKKLRDKCRMYHDFVFDINNSRGLKRIIKSFIISCMHILHIKYDSKSYYRYQDAMKEYADKESGLWCDMFVIDKDNLDRNVKQKDWYNKCIDMPFEFVKVKVPSEFEKYLSNVYGNWKEYVVGTSIHGGCIWEPYVPYKEYLDNEQMGE